ncbi:MAG: hypothetical protein K1X53_00625 [Candidatus Sumerlaeaceae bacterium]|nr:hypothetical protein [Candidatus Sumerlaeaceae bacterium]
MAQPASVNAVTSDTLEIQFVLTVPEDTTRTVFITGSHADFGPWNPARQAMTGSGAQRTYSLRVAPGTAVEYKFTLGSWDEELLDENGRVPGNFRLMADKPQRVEHKATRFGSGPKLEEKLSATGAMKISGTTRMLRGVASKHLSLPRDVIVLLPPGYAKDRKRRYSVLYMHDGQNLFDPKTSFLGVDWGVDEALARLVPAGKVEPLIVVGIYNTAKRREELDPEVEGEKYAKFIIEELKPRIDREFRTKANAAHTGTAGSSMGGIISVYLGWKHPETFSRIGALSVHFPLHGGKLIEQIKQSGAYPKSVRVYMDYGTTGIDANYEGYVQLMADQLRKWGWKEGRDFLVHKAEGEGHNEAAWRRRIDLPLEFLFPAREAGAAARRK